MNDISAKLKFNHKQLWRLEVALKHRLDHHREHAESHDDINRVFKMNVEEDLKLYLKIAPLVESFQSVQATLDKYPLEKFNTIR